jgi:prophage regulatory protein
VGNRDLVDLSTQSSVGEVRLSRLLRLAEVLNLTALGRTATYALIARGDFPPPIKVGRTSRWVEQEVEDWICRLMQERGNERR